MNKTDKYMNEAIKEILRNGYKDENPRPKYEDGTPAHTLSINHAVRKYDLSKGEFPICMLRPQAWKSGIKEVLWIYQDASNSLDLLREKYNVHYWNEWESKDVPNTIGKRYGYIVKKYDLMNKLLKGLIENPYGRRHIIDLYQYQELEETDGLYPCAFLTVWNVRKGKENKEYLDMTLFQRSGDMLAASGAGGINEIQYTALLMMVARHCGYKVGVFTHFIANEQIYDRHIEQAEKMLNRYATLEMQEYFGNRCMAPKLILNPNKKNFYDITIDDFTVIDYEPIKPQLKLELGI